MKLRRKDKTERLPLSKAEANRLGRWVLAALGIHAVIFLVTSVGFIRDTWVDPAGAKQRAETEAAAKAAAAPAAPATGAQAPKAGPEANAKPTDAGKPTDPNAKPASKVVQETTATAKPGEIPKHPDDLGISLDETNPK